MAIVVGLMSAPARATTPSCSTEQGVFWKLFAGGYGFVYGDRNEIPITDHSTSCTSGTDVSQTAHMVLNGVYGNWVESGWQQYNCGITHCFQWFGEWGLNFTTHSYDPKAKACANPGTLTRYEVINVPGTNNWNVWGDCEDGAGWSLIVQYTGTGYQWGTAAGEGSRYGDATLLQNHQNLQWQDATTAWNYATDVACFHDDADGWMGQKDSPSHFEIVAGSASC
jgi:hypothetical protein